MADSASESDSSSLDGGAMLPPSTVSRDQLQKRIESLQQQNRLVHQTHVLKKIRNINMP